MATVIIDNVQTGNEYIYVCEINNRGERFQTHSISELVDTIAIMFHVRVNIYVDDYNNLNITGNLPSIIDFVIDINNTCILNFVSATDNLTIDARNIIINQMSEIEEINATLNAIEDIQTNTFTNSNQP